MILGALRSVIPLVESTRVGKRAPQEARCHAGHPQPFLVRRCSPIAFQTATQTYQRHFYVPFPPKESKAHHRVALSQAHPNNDLLCTVNIPPLFLYSNIESDSMISLNRSGFEHGSTLQARYGTNQDQPRNAPAPGLPQLWETKYTA